MKILVIGGSYFFGKAFVELAASEHEVHVLNRGSRPLKDPRVREYVMDRRDAAALSSIPERHFDAVVDFCAYGEDDIRTVTENLRAELGRYIFISTCDVYRRGTGEVLGEDSPLEERQFPGPEGAYISGKAALERELVCCCERRGCGWVSLRPAFLYGPGNYAPREGMYFQWIQTAGEILHPSDADGEFQMVYVRDAARAALSACGSPLARNRAYNLCGPEYLTYESFAAALEQATGRPFARVELSVEEVQRRGIPLPFPLTRGESMWYDGRRALELGVSYIPLAEGLGETWTAWRSR